MKNGKWTNVLGITGQVHHGDNAERGFMIEGELKKGEIEKKMVIVGHSHIITLYFVYIVYVRLFIRSGKLKEILGYRAG